MIPEDVWKSAKMRAWLIGAGFGVLGGVVSGGVGAFAGLCCLFQFANILTPALLGIVGGGVGAASAKWADFPPGSAGAGTGVWLGLRAGGFAAMLASFIGFLATLLWPVVMVLISALESKQDVGEQIVASIAVMGMSALWAVVFSGMGAFLGVALGAGTGAIAGLIFAKK